MAINAGLRRDGQYRNQKPNECLRAARSEATMLHIDIPTLAEFKALAQVKGETCVSLYLPTSPLGENAKLNRTAFKDIAKEALSQLKEAGADKKKIAVFEGQFEHLAGPEHDIQDEDKIRKLQRAKPDPIESFWHYQGNGLAVLATVGKMRMFRLPDRPKPLAVGGGSISSDAADPRHDLAARCLRACAGGRKRPAGSRLRQLSAGAAAGSKPAQECGGGDTASILPRARSTPQAAEP